MSVILPLLLCMMAELPTSSDVRPIPVTGVVVDRSGRPLRDAEIWLTRATRVEEDRKSGLELTWSAMQAEDEEPPLNVMTRTDAEGRFRLEVPVDFAARSEPIALAVWAIRGDGTFAFRRLPRILRSDDPPLRLSVGTVTRTELTLAGPDGQPIADARVVPSRVMEMPVPESLGRRFAGLTDRQGRFVLPGLSRGALGEVRIETPSLGVQRVVVDGDEKTTIALAPVGVVSGRLIAPEDFAQPIKGVNIRVKSNVGGFEGSGIAGEAEVACDPSGRFEIPVVAAGLLTFKLVFDREQGTPLRGEPPSGLVLTSGAKVEIKIPLRPTVLVRGVVREKETKRPIAGVRLEINGWFGGDRFAMSDTSGNYSARIVREVNQPFGWPIRIPRPFYWPDGAPEVPQSMPARDRAELLLPPLELSRGVDLSGIVLDEAGKPVADAEVDAVYGQALLTRTDPRGSFVLSGIDPLRELKIEARRGDASSGRTPTLRAGNTATSPLSLTIRRGTVTRLAGRVVDRSGRPIGGASVRIWRQLRQQYGSLLKEPVAGEDGSIVLRTGGDGRFHTTRPLPPDDEYFVDARAPGRFSVRTEAQRLTGVGHRVPYIVLNGLRTVTGQVIDRQGQPVAGVRVLQSGDGPLRTEAMTGSDGQFGLPGVIEGPAFVFASKDGYRFDLQTIELDNAPIKLTLTRSSEPPARSYTERKRYLRSLSPGASYYERRTISTNVRVRINRVFSPCMLRIGTPWNAYRRWPNRSAIPPCGRGSRRSSWPDRATPLCRSHAAWAAAAAPSKPGSPLTTAGASRPWKIAPARDARRFCRGTRRAPSWSGSMPRPAPRIRSAPCASLTSAASWSRNSPPVTASAASVSCSIASTTMT